MLRYLFVGTAATVLWSATSLHTCAQTQRKPNVVVIIMDSTGYTDSEPYTKNLTDE